jgi:hypothetical protein
MFQLSLCLNWFFFYLLIWPIASDFPLNSGEKDRSLKESNECTNSKNECSIANENGVDHQVAQPKSSANNGEAGKHVVLATGCSSSEREIHAKKFLVKMFGNLTFLSRNSMQRAVSEFFWSLFPTNLDGDSEHNRLTSHTYSFDRISLAQSNRMVAVESSSKACINIQSKKFPIENSATVYLREQGDRSTFKSEIFRQLDVDHIEFRRIHDGNSHDPSGFGDDVCAVLYVYSLNRGEANEPNDPKLLFTYELVDPIELQLGMTVRHARDFAYMPVMSSTGGRTSKAIYYSTLGELTEFSHRLNDGSMNDVQEVDTSLVEGFSLRKEDWWKWLIPSRWWKDKIKHDKFSSDYKKGSEAFAGGM